MPDDKCVIRSQSDSQQKLKMCCFAVMWLLIFICTSTVCAVPINRTHENSHSPVDVVALNDTQNVISPVPGTVVSVVDLPEQVSSETLVDDMTVQEGDILMPEDRNAVQTLWSDAVVPFAISAELAYQESNIFAAFKMISDFTCIRFRRHTTEFNYLKLIDGNGCASFIGCQGGPQPLYYSRTCSVGNLCHELIHALGLHHEHTRQDRNQYVNVQWQNIIPGAKINFVVKSGNTLNLPYDLNSIMHYGKFFFSVNGNATMLPRYSTEQMGQRTHLSPLDIQKLNKLYHCDQRSTWH